MLLRPRSMDAEEVACILRAMETLDPFPPTDPLGEALHFLRMNGAFYCRSELSAPWGLTLRRCPATSGSTSSRPAGSGSKPTTPRAGCCSRRPRAGAPRRRALPAERPGVAAPGILDLRARARQRPLRDPAPRWRRRAPRLICGAVRFDHPPRATSSDPAGVDPPTGGGHASHEWIRSTLSLMAAEAKELRPGGEAVITRLGDIIVIQAIRSWIETRRGRANRLARRVAGPPDRSRHRADPSRPCARLDGRIARAAKWRCRDRRSRPASPNWSASPRCSTSPAGGCSWRSSVLRGRASHRRRARQTASATGPRRPSARAFKRIIGVSPGSVTQPLRSPANLWR